MFQDNRQILKLLESDIQGLPVAVLGDIMLDRYYFGEVKRISPEAPVPVTRVLEEREILGGAANVGQNLAKLGCKVYLAGVAGADENRQKLEKLLHNLGIESEGLLTVNRPTTTKVRVMGGHQQMLRLDFEETGDISPKQQKFFKDYLAMLGNKGIRALIISDYAKGVCSRQLCQYAIKWANQVNIPVVVDPKGTDWRKYAGAGCITPNLKELGAVVRSKLTNNDRVVENAAKQIRKRFNIENMVVTRSEKGLSVINARSVEHIPTRAQEVFDVSGAGDTVIAALGAAVGAGILLNDAAQLANLAAGIAVGKIGTYAVSCEEILGVITAYLAEVSTRIAAAGSTKRCDDDRLA